MGSGVLPVSLSPRSVGVLRRSERVAHTLVPLVARADYVKDEDIQKLIQWKSPYDLSNEQQDVEFTDDENAAILRLPRKACTPFS